MRGRFAPSPTGDLHIGGAWTALAAWFVARQRDGALVLRVEDLDPPRTIKGSSERILDDLKWLGIDWDEGPDVGGPFGPYSQSERSQIYEDAIEKLAANGLLYECDCSRAEIARIASAPHPGEEVVYPGTCRTRDQEASFKRSPAIRVRVHGKIRFVDKWMGEVEEDLAKAVGDFVLKRADGVYAYQLAVVVDDHAMGITDVVRGADLLSSTARQIYLLRELGAETIPTYWHVPLVVAADGERLAKRGAGTTIRELRAKGITAEEMIGRLGHGLGLLEEPSPCTTRELLKRSKGIELAGQAMKAMRPTWPIPKEWASVD